MFTLTACGESEPEHTHNYSTLKYNNESHWFECECEEKNNITLHNIINGGCVCGYVLPHTHSYTELKHNETQHWNECVCGAFETKENHKLGATATETTDQKCTECEYVITPALGHVHTLHLTKVDAKPQSCTEEGNREYYTCECGRWFSDNTATIEIVDKTSVVIQKDIHSYNILKHNETQHWDECVCGDKTTPENHIESNWITDENSTCQKEGAQHKECSVCKKILQIEAIKKKEHEKNISQEFKNSQECIYCYLIVSLELDLCDGSITLYEENDRYYCIQSNVTKEYIGDCFVQQSNNTTSTQNVITINKGTVNLIVANLNINADTASPITVMPNGNLQLTLLGENKLICTASKAGVWIPELASIEINGTGKITVTGGKNSAGIGGNYKENAGNITINNGTIIAKTIDDEYCGAGIGGGTSGHGGTIIINGGDVYAESRGGAGIGGGRGCYNMATGGSSGDITINGGKVEAKSIYGGAGIGGGSGGSGGNVDEIIITGGIIIASSGSAGAGIGGGRGMHNEGYKGGNGGTITITGGEITATSNENWFGSGCGIGCGYGYTYGTGGTITIKNATISATGRYGIGYNCDYIGIDAGTTIFDGTCHEKFTVSKLPTTECGIIGSFITLSVSVEGANNNYTYQWRKWDGSKYVLIDGENSSTTIILLDENSINFTYSCIVTNGWNNIQSTSSTKIVELSYTNQPQDVTANTGEYVIFEVETSCSLVTYQWQKSIDNGNSWINMEGKENSILAFSTTANDNNTQYRCVVTASNGDVLVSNIASLVVL